MIFFSGLFILIGEIVTLEAKLKIVEIKKFRRKKEYYVNTDDGGQFTLLEDTLLKFGVFPDREYSNEEWERIRTADELRRVKEQAVRYLSRRNHGRRELERKLILKGFTKDSVSIVMDELEEKNYINDEIFLRQFIGDRLNFTSKGKNVIIKELTEKGFSYEKIKKVWDELSDAENELLKAEKAGLKKWKSLVMKNDKNSKIKLKRFLINKGYEVETVNKAIDKITGKET